MKEVFIPQANLMAFKAEVSRLNKHLAKGGFAPVRLQIGVDRIVPWWVSRHRFSESEMTWVTDSVKEKVRLQKVSVVIPDRGVNLGGMASYFSSEGVIFNELLNEPESLRYVPFTASVCSPKDFKIGFSDTRAVKCDHCDSSRRRSRAFIVSDDGSHRSTIGASCLSNMAQMTALKIVKWYGYYSHVEEASLGKLSRLRRMNVTDKPDLPVQRVSIELFITALFNAIKSRREYHDSKRPSPTFKSAFSAVVSGPVPASGFEVKRFLAWSQKVKPSSKYAARGKKKVEKCRESGVLLSDAAMLSSFFASFLRSIKFDFGVDCYAPGDHVSGFFKVESCHGAGGAYEVLLSDVWGRVYKGSSGVHYDAGSFQFITARAVSVNRDGVYPLHIISGLSDWKI